MQCFEYLIFHSAAVAALEAGVRERDEKVAGLEKNLALLQKRAKARIQQLTQEKEAAEQQVRGGRKA